MFYLQCRRALEKAIKRIARETQPADHEPCIMPVTQVTITSKAQEKIDSLQEELTTLIKEDHYEKDYLSGLKETHNDLVRECNQLREVKAPFKKDAASKQASNAKSGGKSWIKVAKSALLKKIKRPPGGISGKKN